ncbi:MAG TPA: bifunctional adenosylcobinamide kinase/adenosylcobinamide-phosphate guanylyltransferase [Actinomycetes bacterium]|jgi:adenosyl cobinamide kinase/adenosyl cobinamide phosphate guanylyltransferase|nr:bifunctional adenosylcobinamide kinase/adenosylcobinamide-phosphate guanylyltransferase [Actinomycetes bacterium]
MALTLLLGGARSGKSALAVRLARGWAGPVALVATLQPRDQETAERIERHRAERPPGWATVEAPSELEAALAGQAGGAFVIVDCLTLWVANLVEQGLTDERVAARAAEAAKLAAARPGPTVAVSNEVGSGIVPVNPLARRYRDLLGRVNATWAAAAANAVLLVAGRALPLLDAEALAGLVAPGAEPPA